MVAPAYLTNGSVASATAASAAVPVPTGTAVNDLIVAFLFKKNNAVVTSPSGWTALTPQAPATDTVHYAFYKVASAADTGTYSFTWTGSVIREAVAFRISGANPAAPVDGGTGAPNSAGRASAATTTPAVSLTTQGVDRLLLWCGANFTGGAWTPPSGYGEVYDNAGQLGAATVTQAVAGVTGSVTGTCATSEYETAWLMSIAPLPPGGTPADTRCQRYTPLLPR